MAEQTDPYAARNPRDFEDACVVPTVDRATVEAWAARGSGDAGGFRLDPEAARVCLAQIDRAIQDLVELQEDLRPFRVLPGPRDLVSKNFVLNCTTALEEARTYFATWSGQLESARTALKRQVDSYEIIEEQNRRMA